MSYLHWVFHPVCPPTYILGDCLIPAVSSQTDLGIIVDALKFHEHAHSTAQKAGAVTQNLLKSTVCRSPEFVMHLFRVHICPIIEYASELCGTLAMLKTERNMNQFIGFGHDMS